MPPERRGLRPRPPGGFAPRPLPLRSGAAPPIAVQSEGGKLSGKKVYQTMGGSACRRQVDGVGNPERRPVGRSPGYPRRNPKGRGRGAKAPVPVFNSCADRRMHGVGDPGSRRGSRLSEGKCSEVHIMLA